MAERGTVRLFTVFAATMAWFGILLQLYLSLKLSLANGKTVAEDLIIYFGYFTILTNILVALVLTIPLVAPVSSAGRFFARPGVGTATAAAITVVGLAMRRERVPLLHHAMEECAGSSCALMLQALLRDL